MTLDFLLRYWARTGRRARARRWCTHSFVQMARGGIYDQVGGGFARYAVDAHWLVPHFEKMLYDNALLVRLGAHLWQATNDAEVRRVTEETIDWVAREMTSPEGGFYSSLDADSEGHEGKFYVWSAEELDALLGDDAPLLRAYWGVTDDGNFEGQNILSVPRDRASVAARFRISTTRAVDERDRACARDAVRRATRACGPGCDDKILAAWNGLMVRGIAEAARAFGDDDYRALAVESGEFSVCDDGARRPRVPIVQGRRARIAGYLEDHAALGLAALALYELTFDRRGSIARATLADAIVRWFWDDDDGRVLRHRVRPRAAHHASARRHRQRDAVGDVARGRAAARGSPSSSATTRCAGARDVSSLETLRRRWRAIRAFGHTARRARTWW